MENLKLNLTVVLRLSFWIKQNIVSSLFAAFPSYRKALLSLTFLSFLSFGQELLLNGTVSDKKTGEPIYAATISTDKLVTQTDFDGNFLLKVNLHDTITIAYIGMETKKIKVDTVSLHVQLYEINELMVVYGPPIQPIRQVDHSVARVTETEIRQNRKITGQILSSEHNDILVGAVIKNKKTGKITYSDVEGNFEIAVSKRDIIEIHFPGMSTHKLKVTDKNRYVVRLKLKAVKTSKKLP